jgi:hypothetical protein
VTDNWAIPCDSCIFLDRAGRAVTSPPGRRRHLSGTRSVSAPDCDVSIGGCDLVHFPKRDLRDDSSSLNAEPSTRVAWFVLWEPRPTHSSLVTPG